MAAVCDEQIFLLLNVSSWLFLFWKELDMKNMSSRCNNDMMEAYYYSKRMVRPFRPIVLRVGHNTNSQSLHH